MPHIASLYEKAYAIQRPTTLYIVRRYCLDRFAYCSPCPNATLQEPNAKIIKQAVARKYHRPSYAHVLKNRVSLYAMKVEQWLTCRSERVA